MTKFEALAADAMTAMLAEIEKYQLDTLKHYPTDIEKDRKLLLYAAEPGAQFGWKVGHAGTHLIRLGLHPKRNEYVTYVTRDSASDRFYLLEFTYDGFRLKEMTAKQFEALNATRVPYVQDGRNESFWLTKNGSKIGYCQNEFIGDHQTAKYRSTLSFVPGISKGDQTALYLHANYSCVALAHSLFFQHEVVEKQLQGSW